MSTRTLNPCVRPQVLVDTTVWLDYFTDRLGTARQIAAVFDGVERNGGTLLTALPTLVDLFYLVPAYLRAELTKQGQVSDSAVEKSIAWACLRTLRERSVVVGADLGDCLEAEYLRQLHDNFGDDLVLAAAKRGKADYLLTENPTLRQHAPLAALSVSEMCTLLDIEEDRV